MCADLFPFVNVDEGRVHGSSGLSGEFVASK